MCNLFPWLCWYVEVFKGGFEGVLVSLLLNTMGAFSYLKFSIEDFFFGKRSSGILVTWPVHLNCANFRRVCTLCIPVLFSLKSCLAIWSLEVFQDSLYGSGSVFWHAVGKLSKFRMRIIVLAALPIYIHSALCRLIPFRSQILPRSRPNAALALAILALTSWSMCTTTLDNVLPR